MTKEAFDIDKHRWFDEVESVNEFFYNGSKKLKINFGETCNCFDVDFSDAIAIAKAFGLKGSDISNE